MNKLIFISDSLADVEQTREFAEKNNYSVEHYSVKDWEKSYKIPLSRRAVPSTVIPISSRASGGHACGGLNSLNLDKLHENAIREALTLARGNVSRAAMLLKVGRATFYRKARGLKLKINSFRPGDVRPLSLSSVKKLKKAA